MACWPSADTDHGAAVATSLGLLGVLSTVTMRAVPAFRMHYSIDCCPFAHGVQALGALAERYEALSLVYWPVVDKFRLELGRRLTAQEERYWSSEGEGGARPAMPTHSRCKLWVVNVFNWLASVIWWLPEIVRAGHNITILDGAAGGPFVADSSDVISSNVTFGM